MEKTFQGCGNPLLRIYFPFPQAVQQFLGGQVHVDNLIGFAEDSIWNSLMHLYPDPGLHRIIKAFQMLYIDSVPA